MHILLTPHSQQNLAQSTGYLVPHSWQNLIPGVEHSTSLSFFISFLRGGEKARKTVGPFGSENKSSVLTPPLIFKYNNNKNNNNSRAKTNPSYNTSFQARLCTGWIERSEAQNRSIHSVAFP